jgi:hypothetical protein
MSTDIINVPNGLAPAPAAAAGAAPAAPAAPAPLSTVSLVGKYFVENDRSLKVLIVLCRGILDVDGNQLLDVASEPWKSIKPFSKVKPSTVDYRVEITRRWKALQPPPQAHLGVRLKFIR